MTGRGNIPVHIDSSTTSFYFLSHFDEIPLLDLIFVASYKTSLQTDKMDMLIYRLSLMKWQVVA